MEEEGRKEKEEYIGRSRYRRNGRKKKGRVMSEGWNGNPRSKGRGRYKGKLNDGERKTVMEIGTPGKGKDTHI